MIEFSIICLVVIICLLQHLLNWAARAIIKDKDLTFVLVIIIFLVVLATYNAVIYIIKWGCQLSL